MIKFDVLWKHHPTVASLLDDFPCKKNGKKLTIINVQYVWERYLLNLV